MNANDVYLPGILRKYAARELTNYSIGIELLKSYIRKWKPDCHIAESGSRAKGTAISLASDVDYLVSYSSDENDLCAEYNLLFKKLREFSYNIRKQNVSFRLELTDQVNSFCGQRLEVDITPARSYCDNTGDSSLWVNKLNTWKKTNIQRHISDISCSGRTNEIKLLKVWRELNKLDFPSIYLEYLIVNIILDTQPKGQNYLAFNFCHVLSKLASYDNNPLDRRLVDPANSNNVLSELLSIDEKKKIIQIARASCQASLSQVLW